MLVSNQLVSQMKPGSVLVDIAIDQGGCFEDSHPTTHADPTYRVHNSLFYCVANMPGAVPHTSTYALTNVTLPYVLEIANLGWRDALRADPALALGLNTQEGDPHLPAGRRVARPALGQPERGAELITVADAIGGYLDHLAVERGLAASTLESYRRDLLRYADALAGQGKTAMGQLTGADIAAFLAGLREGDEQHGPLAASSAGRAVIAVRGLHAFAAAQGLTAADPARLVRPPAPPRRLPKAITVDEVERLLAATGPMPGPGTRPGRAARPARSSSGTGPCWSSSTAPARGSPRPSASTSTSSIWPATGWSGCPARAASSASSRSAATRARHWRPTWCGPAPPWPRPPPGQPRPGPRARPRSSSTPAAAG